MIRPFIALIVTAIFITLVAGTVSFYAHPDDLTYRVASQEPLQQEAPASTTPPAATTSPVIQETLLEKESSEVVTPSPIPDTKPIVSEVESVVPTPLPTTTISDADLNSLARGALVNILCLSSSRSLRPISGSGVIIDPRGVILTNAHVAQFVLLSSVPNISLSCSIRSGSPARDIGKADVLFLSPSWVAEHAQDIGTQRPLGTGEHDFALLRITAISGATTTSFLPFIPFDTNEITQTGAPVLLAAYPAEFGSGEATRSLLNASTAFSSIRQLLTFVESTVDLISLGGIAVAQSGSSGGAVVNQDGKLIGIISTTSEGETTEDRDLRAITLPYINRALSIERGVGLKGLLDLDINAEANSFMLNKAPVLAKRITDYLPQQ